MIGSTELIVIVAVIVILFGSSAIPKFARSLGQAKSEFEKGFKGAQKEHSDIQPKESDDIKQP